MRKRSRSVPFSSRPSFRKSRLRFLLVPLLCYGFYYSYHLLSRNANLDVRHAGSARSRKAEHDGKYLLMPLTHSGPGFCRELFALHFTGYPIPVLINWGGTRVQSHLAKITETATWLDSLDGRPDDVVLMLDALDVWPQLPADMFYDIYGSYPGFTGAIFGAGKRCAPQPTFLAWCNLFPESRLPRDVYGEGTDVVRDDLPVYDYEVSEHLHDDPSHPESFVYGRYEKVRPRYGNSGTLVGRRAALQTLFAKTIEELHLTSKGQVGRTEWQRSSDQFHFNEAIVKAIMREETVGVMDTDIRLFQTMIHAYHDVNYTTVGSVLEKLALDQKKTLDTEEWRDRRIAYNLVARRIPPFVHFAGPKYEMDGRWEKMWWNGDDEEDASVGQALAFFQTLEEDSRSAKPYYGAKLPNGTHLSWTELCGPYTDYI